MIIGAIGLSVSLPIFNRNQGNIRAAKISVAQKAHKEEYARAARPRMNYSPSYGRLGRSAIQLLSFLELWIGEGFRLDYRRRET